MLILYVSIAECPKQYLGKYQLEANHRKLEISTYSYYAMYVNWRVERKCWLIL